MNNMNNNECTSNKSTGDTLVDLFIYNQKNERQLLAKIENMIEYMKDQQLFIHNEYFTGRTIIDTIILFYALPKRKYSVKMAQGLNQRNILIHALHKRRRGVLDSDSELYRFMILGSDLDSQSKKSYLTETSAVQREVNLDAIYEWMQMEAEGLRKETAQRRRMSELLAQIRELRSNMNDQSSSSEFSDTSDVTILPPPQPQPQPDSVTPEVEVTDSSNELITGTKRRERAHAVRIVNRDDNMSVSSDKQQQEQQAPPRSRNLLQVLNNAHERHLLKQFARSEYSAESIEFWECIQDWKQLKNPNDRFEMKNKIYDTFLAPNCLFEINIPSTLREDIQQHFENERKQQKGKRGIANTTTTNSNRSSLTTNIDGSFEMAEREVERCITDIWGRFKYSSTWLDYTTTNC